jgi:hypothetical protein
VRILLRFANQHGDQLILGFGGKSDLAHSVAAFTQGIVALDSMSSFLYFRICDSYIDDTYVRSLRP